MALHLLLESQNFKLVTVVFYIIQLSKLVYDGGVLYIKVYDIDGKRKLTFSRPGNYDN